MQDGRPHNFGRRWSRDLSKRSLERVAVSQTADALRAEGLDVRDCWSPESEPLRHPERRRRPDGLCIVDGIPTVIEHTMFLTDPRAKEWVAAAARYKAGELGIGEMLSIVDRRSDQESDAFLEATIAGKGDQHVEWGRGILVVMHNWDQPANLLREAIERRASVPWWRVYWIDRSPPAILVWEEPAS